MSSFVEDQTLLQYSNYNELAIQEWPSIGSEWPGSDPESIFPTSSDSNICFSPEEAFEFDSTIATHAQGSICPTWAEQQGNEGLFSISPSGRRGSMLNLDDTGAEATASTRRVSLRTASRKKKTRRQSSQGSDKLVPAVVAAREVHNQIEKKYRDRLNGQFQKLLSVLPDSEPDSPEGVDSKKNRQRSRANVLDSARQRISDLEKENERLADQNADLLQRFNPGMEMGM